MEGGVENNGGGGGGGGDGGDSDMMEFGDNSSSGLSSALMMMPLMNSGPHHITNTQFLPLPFTNNSNHQRVSAINMFQGIGKTGHDQDRNSSSSRSTSSGMKAKIMAHPLFPRLLAAYVNCQKVGAPPEVVARLEEVCSTNSEAAAMDVSTTTVCIGEDPALDQFMEAYCEMLTKYEQELTKPFKEAMLFLSSIQCQLKALTVSSSSDSACGTNFGGQNNGCCEEDVEVVVNDNFIDPQAEDRELKVQLLRKYSGYLGSLKQEFMKKKKNGKLPKEARQQLLDWWSRHYKWPYPSEAQKLALAESTGLDLKQINNWFINQRKRHWKPSEEMQFVVMDAAHHHHPHYYMDSMMYSPFPMDCSSSLL